MADSQVKQDQSSDLSVVESIRSALVAATVTGQTVDLAPTTGFFRSATVVVNVGTVTDGTHLLTLEESDDNFSTSGTVAAADLVGSFAANLVTNTPVKVGYIGTKRYLRVKSTVSGSPLTGAQYSASIVRGRPSTRPAPTP